MNDAVKLLPLPELRGGWYFMPTDNYGLYKLVNCNNGFRGIWNHKDAELLSQAMNAPTSREQELEAQNKALWELVGKIVGANNLRVAHGDETYLGAAMMEADAAIQKAKGSR